MTYSTMQLLWMKGNVFVGIDDNHTLWFSQHDNSTNIYELIVHFVTEPAPYTCMLMSTDVKVVSSVTQYVSVDGKQSYMHTHDVDISMFSRNSEELVNNITSVVKGHMFKNSNKQSAAF